MAKVYPPGHPLRSAQLKLKRANIHIRALNQAMRHASSYPEISVRRQGKLDVPRRVDEGGSVVSESAALYTAQIDPRIGVGWGLIVGDILSNLRSTLDHIAWPLAQTHAAARSVSFTPEEERRIVFPLRMTGVTQQAIIGGLNGNDLQWFPPNSHSVIEKFQPYNRTQWPELKLLGVLAELVNEDKHRVVTTVRRDVFFRFLRDQELVRTNLHEPTEINFYVVESVSHDLEPAGTFQVVLNVPCYAPAYFAPADDFRRVHNFIRDEVIPAFAGFFS